MTHAVYVFWGYALTLLTIVGYSWWVMAQARKAGGRREQGEGPWT